MFKVITSSIINKAQDGPSQEQVSKDFHRSSNNIDNNSSPIMSEGLKNESIKPKQPSCSDFQDVSLEIIDEVQVQQPRSQPTQMSLQDLEIAKKSSFRPSSNGISNESYPKESKSVTLSNNIPKSEGDKENNPPKQEDLPSGKKGKAGKKKKGILSLFQRKSENTANHIKENKNQKADKEVSESHKNGKSASMNGVPKKQKFGLEREKASISEVKTKIESLEISQVISKDKAPYSKDPKNISSMNAVEGNERVLPSDFVGSLDLMNTKIAVDEEHKDRQMVHSLVPNRSCLPSKNLDLQESQQISLKPLRGSTSDEIEIITSTKVSFKGLNLKACEDPPSLVLKSSVDAPPQENTKQKEKQSHSPPRKAILIYTALYFLSGIIVSIATSIAASTYPQTLVQYHRWGHALFEGVFMAIMIAAVLKVILKKAEAENPLVIYRHYWAFVVTALVLSPLLSILLFYIVDSARYWDSVPSEELKDTSNLASVTNWGLYSQLYYIICKLGIILLNLFIYHIYLYSKKYRHVQQSQQQRKSFFYADIYKNFQQELHKMKVNLHEIKKTGSIRSLQSLDEAEKSQKRKSESMEEIVGKTLKHFHQVMSLKRNLGTHLIIAVICCQLLASFGYFALVRAALEHNLEIFVYLGAVAYPMVTGLIKAIALKIEADWEVGMGPTVVHIISMTTAAISYRYVYFYTSNVGQAIGIILIKVAYKIVVYVLFGGRIKWFQQLWEKVKAKPNRKQTPIKTLKRSKSLGNKNEQGVIAISVLASISLEDEGQKKQQLFDTRFAFLQFADCTAIISMLLTLAILSSSQVLQGSLAAQYSSGNVGKIVGYSFLELALDVGLVVVVAMLAKRDKSFSKLKFFSFLYENLKSGFLAFVGTSLMVYYTSYLTFPKYV